MKEYSYIWEAWVGQKIRGMETLSDGRTRLILEDGRGIYFRADDTQYFVATQYAVENDE